MNASHCLSATCSSEHNKTHKTHQTHNTNNKFFILSYSFFPLESHNSIIPWDVHRHSIILKHVHSSPQIDAPSVWDCKSKTKLVISPNLCTPAALLLPTANPWPWPLDFLQTSDCTTTQPLFFIGNASNLCSPHTYWAQICIGTAST